MKTPPPLWVALGCALAVSACTANRRGPEDGGAATRSSPSKSRSQTPPVSFRLHKNLSEQGLERDTYLTLPSGETEAKATFAFRDRTVTVALAAIYRLGPAGAMRSYRAWGKSSRFHSFDDRVEALPDGAYRVTRQGKPPKRERRRSRVFALSGYAPMLGHDLLLRAWVRKGRPPSMETIPAGRVRIASRGHERYRGESGKPVTLEHVALHGVVWGREDAWLDSQGQLVALVTRDSEFDHFEGVREGFVTLLPELVKRAGVDGAAWLRVAARGAAAGSSGDRPVALVGGRLFDGTARSPIPSAVVVYQGGRIVSAGPSATTKVPPNARSIDLAGKMILPGLWDMHAHFTQVEQGAAYLAAGVTTVRDLGNVLEFITGVRDAIDAGKGLGPRILVAGLVDGAGDAAIGPIRIRSKHDIAPVLDRLKRMGCLEVKIYSSIAPRLIPSITAEAHRRGLGVTGHVPLGMDSLAAIAGGYDAINHLPGVLSPLFPHKVMKKLSRAERFRRFAELKLDDPLVRRIVRTVVEKKIVIDDTIALYEQLLHTREANAKAEPGIAKLPRELAPIVFGLSPQFAKLGSATFEKALGFLRLLHKSGAILVPGTDISVPAHSLHRELELYVRAGMTPAEAIRAATSGAAKVMRLEKEVGTIEPGKRADLIVVGGDPLRNIRDLRKIEWVVARGRLYKPAPLWRLAGFRP